MKLADLAAHLGATLHGDPEAEVTSAAGIAEAGPGQFTFVANPKYTRLARTTRATAVVAEPEFEPSPPGRAATARAAPVGVEPEFEPIAAASLRIANPYLAFARALELFYQPPAY